MGKNHHEVFLDTLYDSKIKQHMLLDIQKYKQWPGSALHIQYLAIFQLFHQSIYFRAGLC